MAYRKEKLEELIKRKTADFLLTEIKDPRIGFVSVTKVELSKDFLQAEIGVSVFGAPRDIRKSLEGLNSAAGYIQHYLAKEISIKHIPRIAFRLDSSLSEGVRMVDLIEGLNAGDVSDESGQN
ncbi:MAG: 30S ribosome-binding factor RbfA [Leptospirales bacterium]|nr:30S ribosome-binding factor RbfA [Leptospirales bacterium]